MYISKQSDGEVPVMLELWGMLNTPSLPLLPRPLWPGVVAPDRILLMGQIELNCSFEILLFLHLNCVFMLKWIARNKTFFVIETVLKLNWIVWIRTVWLNWIARNRIFFFTIKLSTHAKVNCLKKKLITCLKIDLALNNLQRLICHKTQPTNQLTRNMEKNLKTK